MANNGDVARITWRVIKALALVAVSAAMLAQTAPAQNRGAARDPNASSDTDKRPYDKRDFNGLWARNTRQFNLPPCAECGDQGLAPGYGFFGTPPPRTPAGEKKFQANKPGRGYELGSKEANAHPDIDIGYRRAVLPAFGNDPEARCDHGDGSGEGSNPPTIRMDLGQPRYLDGWSKASQCGRLPATL